jgi:hypothetical protein
MPRTVTRCKTGDILFARSEILEGGDRMQSPVRFLIDLEILLLPCSNVGKSENTQENVIVNSESTQNIA